MYLYELEVVCLSWQAFHCILSDSINIYLSDKALRSRFRLYGTKFLQDQVFNLEDAHPGSICISRLIGGLTAKLETSSKPNLTRTPNEGKGGFEWSDEPPLTPSLLRLVWFHPRAMFHPRHGTNPFHDIHPNQPPKSLLVRHILCYPAAIQRLGRWYVVMRRKICWTLRGEKGNTGFACKVQRQASAVGIVVDQL